MFRSMLTIALIASCANHAGKDEVQCGVSWTATPPVDGTCDAACVEMNPGSGPQCTTNIVTGPSGKYVCGSTFEFDGERGCCYDTGMVSRVTGLSEPDRQRRVFFLTCN